MKSRNIHKLEFGCYYSDTIPTDKTSNTRKKIGGQDYIKIQNLWASKCTINKVK